MTPSTIDRPDLEDDIRAALALRAGSTAVDVPDQFTPSAVARPLVPRPDRRTLLVAATLIAVVALAAAVLASRETERPVTPAGGGADHVVEGPTGSRWFLLDLPGLTGEGIIGTMPASPGGRSEMQAFRTDDGFDGPSVWLEPGGVVEQPEGSTPVDLAGTPAFIVTNGDVVRLSTLDDDGSGGFGIIAAHMSTDEVVAFAGGLTPRSGGGWDASIVPEGMTEIDLESPAQPEADSFESRYDGTDGAHYELFTYPGGAATFESWGREEGFSADQISAISVDGRPGLLIGENGPGDTVAVWRPTDDTVAVFRTNLGPDALLDAMDALTPTDQAGWEAQLGTPSGPGG